MKWLLGILLIGVAMGWAFAAELAWQDPALNYRLDTTIETFGVSRDGKGDMTIPLQRMIDSGIGSIHLPRGTYRISKPLVVDLEKVGVTSFIGDGTPRIVMEGAGPAIKFVGTHEGSADPKTVKDNVWQKQRMPLVEGIEIVGGHEAADGIEAVKTMQLTISRVVIRQVRHAVHLTERNRNVVIVGCHFYENHGIGVFLDDVNLHQINITGSHISYNQGGGVVSYQGNTRNIQISGCDIEANVQNVLIDSGGTKYGTAEVAITGCTLQHSGGPDSANVRYIGADLEGERCWGLVTIANNILSDVETNIDIQKARDVVVVGNTISSGYKYNLRVEDSSNVVVGANVMGRNAPYKDDETCDNRVLFRNCDDGTVNGLHVHRVLRGEAGIVLDQCRRFHVSGCTVLDCDKAGILLNEVEDCLVSNNLLSNQKSATDQWQAVKVVGGQGDAIVP
ncbi:right-handed parallel beta-helix repeat-containing protein [Bremerella cremea]|uniref:right-handed parallel beta-helix repeat-containing protein n=1 Tax=Bremerella cremea TaxID=1031537 RepID=UPI001313EBAB|nr:right-handed parallel beta-helix repeat-containing protein [Bremerella cremea]